MGQTKIPKKISWLLLPFLYRPAMQEVPWKCPSAGHSASFWSLSWQCWQCRQCCRQACSLLGWPGCLCHKGLFCGSLFGVATEQHDQSPRRMSVWSYATHTDFVERVVGLSPAHGLCIVVEQLVASCGRTTACFVCSFSAFIPLWCLFCAFPKGSGRVCTEGD